MINDADRQATIDKAIELLQNMDPDTQFIVAAYDGAEIKAFGISDVEGDYNILSSLLSNLGELVDKSGGPALPEKLIPAGMDQKDIHRILGIVAMSVKAYASQTENIRHFVSLGLMSVLKALKVGAADIIKDSGEINFHG